MGQKNYLNAIAQSKLILNNWAKHHLTPFGKVTVVKMLEQFIISLKLTWITCLIRDSDSPWAHMVNHQLNLSSKLFTYGPAWCEKPKTDNPFWKDVLTSWLYISQDCPIKSGQDILHNPLWYDKKLVRTLYSIQYGIKKVYHW